MNQRRGLSQILFGFLPEQTVDLSGRVWRVRRWILPNHLSVDRETVARELLRAIRPWTQAGRDGRLAEDIHRGLPIQVLEVNEHRGVEVEQFPRVFRCRTCSRLERHDDRSCACGARSWVQWHFVAYHDCGYVGPPRFLRCPTHQQVRVVLSGTAAARDLRFECPVCLTRLHQGFFMGARCENCGEDTPLRHDVHRAAQVYSGRTLTLVNPPDSTTAAVLRDPTAAAQKLDWVLQGMPRADATGPSVETVVAGLVAAGLSPQAARQEAERMLSEGRLAAGSGSTRVELDPVRLADAREAALRLWLAASSGRRGVDELAAQASEDQRRLFAEQYPAVVARCGLESVELLDDFPVLTCRFGFTRGSSQPGQATLRRFQGRNGQIAVYGQLARTEGLLFRLDAVRVATWLAARGQLAQPPSDPVRARIRILETCRIPDPFEEPTDSPGSTLLTLVHSLAHRSVRRIATRSGLDRDAIAEYLIPEHLSFVLYAAARGDFVLGGMQALFENDLDLALDEVVLGETRCPLDPGCRKHGRACVACLHLGEPSCRHFNRYLDRAVLFGPAGYLSSEAERCDDGSAPSGIVQPSEIGTASLSDTSLRA